MASDECSENSLAEFHDDYRLFLWYNHPKRIPGAIILSAASSPFDALVRGLKTATCNRLMCPCMDFGNEKTVFRFPTANSVGII
jgi:hypothetical protein